MAKPKRSWFEIKNAADPEEAHLYLYDEIGGYGIQAPDFIAALKTVTAPELKVHINSPGGDVFTGNAIFNALQRHQAKVTTHVDGLAASMASVIAMAGDEVHMAANAMMMIHNPSIGAGGDAGDLRKSADMLDKIKANMVDAYAAKTELDPDRLNEMMDDETWMDADEAVGLGFADCIDCENKAAASIAKTFDLSAYANAPKEWPKAEKPGSRRETLTQRRREMATAKDTPADADKSLIERLIAALKGETKPTEETPEVKIANLTASVTTVTAERDKAVKELAAANLSITALTKERDDALKAQKAAEQLIKDLNEKLKTVGAEEAVEILSALGVPPVSKDEPAEAGKSESPKTAEEAAEAFQKATDPVKRAAAYKLWKKLSDPKR